MTLKFRFPIVAAEFKKNFLESFPQSNLSKTFDIKETDGKLYIRLLENTKTCFGFLFSKDAIWNCAEERIRNVEKDDIMKIAAMEKMISDYFLSLGARIPIKLV